MLALSGGARLGRSLALLPSQLAEAVSAACGGARPLSAAAEASAAAAVDGPSTSDPSLPHTLGGLPMPRFIVVKPRAKQAMVGLPEAISQVKAAARAKFDESVELAVRLGIDPRRGDQMVRGATMLPHGTGKSVRVAVFARDDDAAAARAAGAEVVGSEDLIASIADSGGSGLGFDKCIATPDMMPRLGKIARILGPRGLMPNPKLGTVTANVAEAVAMMKRGRVEFRADKGGVVHAGLGRVSFPPEELAANIGAFAAAVLAARPKGVKGGGASGYLLSATLSSTMGPGVPVTIPSLAAAAQRK